MTELYIKVEPDSDEFSADTDLSIPKIFVKSEAENGRANAELLKKLEKVTGERPAIVSGHKSRRKKLKTSLGKKQFMEKLEAVQSG